MIKFFRKIRHKLMSDNKIGKYLLYAIGEIILVVIGILIALQLNNWKETRKEQKRIYSHYKELRDDLTKDVTNIKLSIDTVKATEKLGLYVYDFLNFKLEKVDSTKLKMAFISTERYAFFSRSKNAYSNLLSSGDIHLIQNKEFKAQLADYHDTEEWFWSVHNGKLKQTLENYGDYIPKFTHPLLIRNFYASNFDFIENDSLESVIPYESLPIHWNRVRTDSNYNTLLSDVMAQRIFQLSFYRRLQNDIQDLLNMLTIEIQQMEN